MLAYTFLSTSVYAAANSDSCDWEGFRGLVRGFQTGYEHQQSCLGSVEEWSAGSMDLSESQCRCLVGFGEPLLSEHNCVVADRPLLAWKKECGEKFCTTDNPEHFCHCDQDELKNVWKVLGRDIHDECSNQSQEWDDGAHIFLQPDAASCKCFHLLENKGLDLGCKWRLHDFSKPWEKSPSMASFAKKCDAQGFVEADYNAVQEFDYTKTNTFAIEENAYGVPPGMKNLQEGGGMNDSIFGTLFAILLCGSFLFICALGIYKCCIERHDDLGKRRRTMIALPATSDIEDEEFGLDSDQLNMVEA